MAVATHAGTVVIGGIGHVGVVYCYYDGCNTLEYLKPVNSIQFGRAVAISSYLLVVGAPLGINQHFRSSGVIFVYDALSLEGLQVADPAELRDGDQFGAAVATYDDYVLVGAPFYENTGAVYLFYCHLNLCKVRDRFLVPGSVKLGMAVALSEVLIAATAEVGILVIDYAGNRLDNDAVFRATSVAVYEQTLTVGYLDRATTYHCPDSGCTVDKILTGVSITAVGLDVNTVYLGGLEITQVRTTVLA